MSCLRMLLSGLVALAILSLAHPQGSYAQPPGTPRLEHFKVYKVEQQVTLGLPVDLYDQFGFEHVIVQRLEMFANPVNQNHEGLEDTLTHFSWWRILDPAPHPTRRILVSNKLGSDQEWLIGPPTHLMTPAIKNITIPNFPLPSHVNHFKCYESRGPTIGRDVVLEDQWGRRTAVVDSAICFCTPVEKVLPDGIRYPIVDPVTNLACYRITPPVFWGVPFFWRDQFFAGPNYALEDVLLCVPSLKDEVVPTQRETWGHLKSTYR